MEPDDGTNSQPTSAAVKAPTTLLSRSRKAPGLPSWNPEDPLAGLQKGVGAGTELRGVHHRGPRGATECGTEESGAFAFYSRRPSVALSPQMSRGLQWAWRSALSCLRAPWWLLGDTDSPAAELVAACRAAEVGGGEEAVAAPTGRGAWSARCSAARTGWLQGCGGSGGCGDSGRGTGLGLPREGEPGRGPGPRAAGPVERTAAPKKDELVSGRLGRRFSLQGKQAVGTKARAGVGKARTVQP